jgi:hypothetical protein
VRFKISFYEELLLKLKFVLFHSTIKLLEGEKEAAMRAAQETERLLQLVQMSQEEQNSKEKTIMDLQQ